MLVLLLLLVLGSACGSGDVAGLPVDAAADSPGSADPCATLGEGAPCDDGAACTRDDTCQAGICVGATPMTCPAPDTCHEPGTCDPDTGECSAATVKADGAACSDGNSCTTDDVCSAGVCGGTPVTCQATDDCHATYVNPCVNCARLSGTNRVARGGAFNNAPGDVDTLDRGFNTQTGRWQEIGIRCARAE